MSPCSFWIGLQSVLSGCPPDLCYPRTVKITILDFQAEFVVTWVIHLQRSRKCYNTRPPHLSFVVRCSSPFPLLPEPVPYQNPQRLGQIPLARDLSIGYSGESPRQQWHRDNLYIDVLGGIISSNARRQRQRKLIITLRIRGPRVVLSKYPTGFRDAGALMAIGFTQIIVCLLTRRWPGVGGQAANFHVSTKCKVRIATTFTLIPTVVVSARSSCLLVLQKYL